MQENAIEWLSTQKVVTVTLGVGGTGALRRSLCKWQDGKEGNVWIRSEVNDFLFTPHDAEYQPEVIHAQAWCKLPSPYRAERSNS